MKIQIRHGLLQLSKIVCSANGFTTKKWLHKGSLPGGNYSGSFNNLGTNANWWTATENSGTNAWNRNMNNNNGNVNRNNNNKTNGFSVRCIRDLLNACYQPAGCWAGFLNF
jgi:uncharacterized protein (TIGR02145 family)